MRVLVFFEQRCGFDSVGRGGAAYSQKIGGEVHADRGEGFLVVRPK